MAEMVIPGGLVDMHVHLREPGAEHKETFETGTMAAIAGGVTAVYDMPNNPEPYTPYTQQRLIYKRALARGDAYSDIGFYYRYQPSYDNAGSFPSVVNLSSGLKTYLEISTGQTSAEAPQDCRKGWAAWHEVASAYQPIIPHVEDQSVEEAIAVAAEIGHPIHIPHVPNRFVLETIIKARQKYGDRQITAGVCPHHLFMNKYDIERLGWYARMKPPLGTLEDQDFLWSHLDDIDVFETDHAPHTDDEKLRATAENPEGNPEHSVTSFGVPGLEAMLPLLLQAVQEGRLTASQLLDKASVRPAQILGYKLDKTSRVKVSMEQYEFGPEHVRSKCGWSPYLGRIVTGKVVQVDMHGDTIYRDGQFLNSYGTGEILLPPRVA